MSTAIGLEERLRARRELPPPAMRRALRQAARLSQADVAREIGVSSAAVAYWEAGRRFPRPENLAAYVRALRILREAGDLQ